MRSLVRMFRVYAAMIWKSRQLSKVLVVSSHIRVGTKKMLSKIDGLMAVNCSRAVGIFSEYWTDAVMDSTVPGRHCSRPWRRQRNVVTDVPSPELRRVRKGLILDLKA